MDKVSIIARDAARQDDIAGVDVSARVGNKADEGAWGAYRWHIRRYNRLTGGARCLGDSWCGSVVLAGEIATTLATTIAGGAMVQLAV